MQIRSTKISRTPSTRGATAQETTVAKLDRQLASGTIPEDVYILPGDMPEVSNQESAGALPLTDGSQRAKRAQRQSLIHNAVFIPMCAVPGALLGMAGLPGAPLLGAAVGAGIGVALAADSTRQFKGKVDIEHDGDKSVRKWNHNPNNYIKTPQELRTILHATGVLGDRVEVVAAPSLEGQSQPALLTALQPHKEQLKNLAKERRLLADLGGKTRYGKSALQLIDGGMARELLGRGKEVQVVSVSNLKDTPHQLSTEARSGIHDQKHLEAYHYHERTFDYQLQPVRSASDLAQTTAGKGLPESSSGVPQNESTFTQTVYLREEKGGRVISRERDATHESLHEVLIGKQNLNAPSRTTAALRNMVDPSTRGFAITGGVLGTIAGAATGINPAVGLTVGAVAGHFVGRASVARTSEDRETSTASKKLVTGLGAAAGLGLGLLAAAQTGDAAMIGCMGVGAFGGMLTGVVTMRNNRPRALGAGQVGFIGGAMFGLGVSAFGGGPIAGVALGALGAVAGGSLAFVGMGRK